MLDKEKILKGIDNFISEHNALYMQEQDQYKDKLDYCNRINKAINYINKYKFKGIESIKDRYLDNELSEELLNILKGE